MEQKENRKLTRKQKAFAENMVLVKNGTEAASLAGYGGTRETLRAIASENLTKPSVMGEISRIESDLRGLFEENARSCLETILSIMNNPELSPFARLSAAKDILDRAGYKPTDKQEISGELMLSTEHTRAIAQRARALLTKGQTTE